MKPLLLIFGLTLALFASGCASRVPGNIVIVKTTTFGFDVSGDPQTQIPHVRLGLIRNFYQVIPTSTNGIYAPSYAASMSAEMRLTSQRGQEDFATGEAANLISNTNAIGNTVAKIGAGQRNIDTPLFADPSTIAKPRTPGAPTTVPPSP